MGIVVMKKFKASRTHGGYRFNAGPTANEQTQTIFNKVSTFVVGVCGSQGMGKTTLIRTLLDIDLGKVTQSDRQTGSGVTYYYSDTFHFSAIFSTASKVEHSINIAMKGRYADDVEIHMENANVTLDNLLVSLADYQERFASAMHYGSLNELIEGLNALLEELDRDDPLGLLMDSLMVCLPLPILRWITLIDMPGEESMFPHRNAFFLDNGLIVDVLLLVVRRCGTALTGDQRRYCHQALKFGRPTKIVITNGFEQVAPSDANIRNLWRQEDQKKLGKFVHVDLIQGLHNELFDFLRELWDQGEIERQIRVLGGEQMQFHLGIHIPLPIIDPESIRTVLLLHINMLADGVDPELGESNLLFAQATNCLLTGIHPYIFYNLQAQLPTEISLTDEITYPIQCPYGSAYQNDVQSFLNEFSQRHELSSPFFQHLNQMEVDDLVKYVTEEPSEIFETIAANLAEQLMTRRFLFIEEEISCGGMTNALLEPFIENLRNDVFNSTRRRQ